MRSTPPVLGDVHSLFIVCDGHMGVGAANHCVQHMPQLLRQLLPQHLPDWTNNRCGVVDVLGFVTRGCSNTLSLPPSPMLLLLLLLLLLPCFSSPPLTRRTQQTLSHVSCACHTVFQPTVTLCQPTVTLLHTFQKQTVRLRHTQKQ